MLAASELFPFESKHFQVSGARLAYVDEGSGEPILFVHGNPTWSFYWRNLIRAFATEYRTIAIDHVGCGRSEKPTDYNYCLQQHINNLVDLTEHLDLSNVTLVVHDWGGAIGIGSLLRNRSRFKQLVVFNTGAFPPPYIPFRIRVCRWPIVGRLAVQGFNAFARAAISMATELPDGLPPSVADGLLAPYDSWQNRIAIYQFVKDIPLTRSHKTWNVLKQIEDELPGLADMPIQIIWGMKDWCFRPECLQRFSAAWPQAQIHELADAGHYVVEDADKTIQKLVWDFLSKN